MRPLEPIQVTSEECDGSFERMLRRFVRRVRDEGVLDEVRTRARGFKKPSERRRSEKSRPR